MAKNYLQQRGNRYYFRMKVPVDLRDAIGQKEIKVSLGTSDFREASRRVKTEAFKAENRFAEERRKAVQHVAANPGKARLSEGEALGLVAKWYRNLETESEEWLEENRDIFHRPDDLQEILETLHTDEFVFSGGGQAGVAMFAGENGLGTFRQILEDNGTEFAGSPDEWKRLAATARRAYLDHTRQSIARLQRTSLLETKEQFRPWRSGNSHEALEIRTKSTVTGATLGQLLDLFMAERKKANRADSTLRTYQAPIRLLSEELGESLPLEQIDRSKMAAVRDLILQLPANATQRYPGKSLREASDLAKREGRPPVEPKTVENYLRNITAIFNFAVDSDMLVKSPAAGKWLKQSLGDKSKGKKNKPVFTAETLKPLFLALSNHSGSAARKVKRESGRFWVPLIGLLQGFRLNEACQIYTEDVIEKEGILCFDICSLRQDGSACEKRLKTESTARIVPVHPWLLKLGFGLYLESRRKDANSARLFPDLPLGKTGYYSDRFQKNFGRFIKRTLGPSTDLTFHCFRHTWRDAARAAKIQEEIVRPLGGWANGREVQSGYGHGYPLPLLRDELQKITFPGLEILLPTAKVG